MSHYTILQRICLGALCLGPALLTTGCTDSDYDLNNVDLTMGLGSDGLSVKLGNTEKIMLNDILDTNESVKTDATGLYYFVREQEADYDFKVNQVEDLFIDNEVVSTEHRVLDGATYVGPITAGQALTGEAVGKPTLVKLEADGVDEAVKRLDAVELNHTGTQSPVPVTLTLTMDKTARTQLEIGSISNYSIYLPAYLHVSDLPQGWTAGEGNSIRTTGTIPVNGPQYRFTVYVDRAHFDAADNRSLTLPDGSHSSTFVTAEANNKASMDGQVTFRATSAFVMERDDYADVQLHLDFGGNKAIGVVHMTGQFDPEMDPDVDDITVADDLPDFLTDDEVRIRTDRQTIKLYADLSNVPADLQIRAHLASYDDKAATTLNGAVELPGQVLEMNKVNEVYYYDGSAPFEPDAEIAADARKVYSEGIGNLIERIPELIKIDLKNKRVQVNQDKAYTIVPAQTYHVNSTYHCYIPFEFNEGLTIVYNDSSSTFNSDVKDYSAEGALHRGDGSQCHPAQPRAAHHGA